MSFTPVGTTGCVLAAVSRNMPDHRPVRMRFHCNSLLRQAEEQLAAMSAGSPVEPKGEFIKVVFQMLVTYGPLMRTQHPPFQQRGDPVAVRQQVVSEFLRGTDNVMAIPFRLQWPIANPSVRLNKRSRLDHLLDCPGQTFIPWHSGQAMPSGHRNRMRYSRHACSEQNRALNSAGVFGYSSMPKYYPLGLLESRE